MMITVTAILIIIVIIIVIPYDRIIAHVELKYNSDTSNNI
jgi:hypothetical protein